MRAEFACCLLFVVLASAVEWHNLKPIHRVKYGTANAWRVGGPGKRAPSAGTRIIGGSDATVGQFPYQVAVRIDDAYFCGGSLIAVDKVLTAAHCVQGFSKWDIHAGALNFSDTTEEGRVVSISTNGQPHENYNAILINNDIAVVHLTESLSGPNIGVVRMPSYSMQNNLFVDELARVSGWGKTSDASDEISEMLQWVDVRVIENSACEVWYGGIAVNDKNICTHTNHGDEATCNGDSGGPLVWYEADGEPTEIGIVSFGSGAGCESRWPSAYTRVTSFLDWIETNAGVVIRP